VDKKYIASNEKDNCGGYKECMNFYIPESLRPVIEAAFARGFS